MAPASQALQGDGQLAVVVGRDLEKFAEFVVSQQLDSVDSTDQKSDQQQNPQQQLHDASCQPNDLNWQYN